LASHFIHKIKCKKPKTKTFDVLKNINLVIKPRTMTLVLAPPGHGKSALLKTLAGQLEPTEGKVTWNGFGKEFSDEKQLRVEKLCQYVDQVDVHLPHLTVRETFQFAVNNAFDPHEYNNPDMDFVHQHKVDMILRQLGLEECADTIVGNELIRGVSGGQRKRVTMGEVMCSDARALFLDEVTSGLDASTAYDVFAAMRSWTDVLGTSVVAALLQPGPELFELFDNVILMRESQIVYAGPRTEVMDHFEKHGLYCPPDQDFADYLVEFLTNPSEVYRKQLKKNLLPTSQSQRVVKEEVKEKIEDARRRHSVSVSQASQVKVHAAAGESIEMSELPGSVNNAVEVMPRAYDEGQKEHKQPKKVESLGGPVPLSTAALAAAYHASPYFAEHQKLLSSSKPKFDMSKLHPLVQRQYGGEFSHSYWQHSKSVLHRQVLYNMRNKGAIYPRLFQAVYMGLVIGSLFWEISVENFTTRVSLIIFCMTALAFSSMVEVPATMEIKRNVFKHYSYRLYPPTAQIIAQMICHFPTALIETIIFSTLVYWMTAFASEAGRFILFIVIIMVVNMAISTFFRFLAYVAGKQEEAEAMVSPSVGIFMLFGGFLISRGDIPPWFIWLYWISPYSWAGRAAATVEFHAERYDDILSSGQRRGSVYLETWSMFDDDHWVYLGIIFQLVWYVIFSILASIAIKHSKIELSRGTKRQEEEEIEEIDENAAVEISTTKLKSALNCPPVTLAFKDLSFTVGKIGSGQEKQLLRNINGFAKPGTLTALMGASGAGKTTLMDVLAGRKTQGLIEGQILVNGKPKVDASFNRIAGYVEQMDSHIPTATVAESLMFSARLRLPASVSEEQRHQVVEETLELLELTDIRDRIVGESEELGLSPGQLKRLTMGVELVANPSVLFLDEPTTGLDSRTALHIVRVIRKVARTGRSVVCTIHQPSAEVFFLFDRMLLLQSGGFPVFFGELGPKAINLEQYLTEIPEVDERPVEVNPASWMLDVIGAGTALGKQAKALESGDAPVVVVETPEASAAPVHNHAKGRVEKFNEIYKRSALYRQNELTLDEAVRVNPNDELVADTGYGASFWEQYKAVQERCFRSHWRNIPYNFTRLFMSLVMSIIFGLIWFDVDDSDQIGLNSKMASMFMGSAFGAMLSCSPQMHALYKQRAAFYRERASRTYSSFAYSTAIGVAELPFFALCSILFVIPLYFLVGFNHNAADFFLYLLAHFMLTMCMGTIAQVLIALFPTVIIAQIFMGTVITFVFLFAGMFIPGPAMPQGWYWIHDIDPMRYILQMLYSTQFHCQGADCTQINFLIGSEEKLMTAREFLEVTNGIDFEGFWWSSFGFMCIYIAILRVLVALIMQFVAHIKR